MLEPAPRKIAPPTLEPTIRVGIVLQEDKLKTIAFKTNSLSNDQSLGAEIGTISISSENQLSLLDSKGSSNSSSFTLEADSQTDLLPKFGVTLNPIVAGRSFHWKQKIEAVFPGKLEFHNKDGAIEVINEVNFEDYLACVVTSEMGAECPLEFMKAQIIAARSWAYVFLHDKHSESNFDVCNDDDCQRYQGSTFLSTAALEASRATRGEFLVFKTIDNSCTVVPSYYYKTCGGLSENPIEIYGFDEPSLTSIQDSALKDADVAPASLETESFIDLAKNKYKNFYCGQAEESSLHKYLGKVDQGGSHFRWVSSISQQALIANLAEKCDLTEVLTRSIGARITSLDLEYENSTQKIQTFRLDSQYKIREALSSSFLPSSAFVYEQNELGDFHFRGAGWGHGVGLCQVGGVMMALAGKSYKEILKHYFPRAELEKSY
jgi:SpoIID/LytB domain protein